MDEGGSARPRGGEGWAFSIDIVEASPTHVLDRTAAYASFALRTS